MSTYLLAHDLGTSGNKATLYDLFGQLISSTVCAYDTQYPGERCVEQHADDWWAAVCVSTKRLLEQTGISNRDIAAVGFSGHMMGCLLVDEGGAPLHPMLIWADTRSTEQEARMIDAVGMARGYRITGHRLSASYSAAKLLWIKDHLPDVYHRAHKMLHANEYIIHRLTGQFVSEYSNASSTNLLDINTLKWSDELLDAFGIPKSLLPELHPSSDIAGKITAEAAIACGLLEGTPVVIGGGDGSCACVGAGVVDEGQCYNIIGSSSWISFATRAPILDPAMRTFNFVHLDPKLYTPTGTMQTAGYAYQWFRDHFYAGEQHLYSLLEAAIGRSAPGAGGLLFLPYLLGERSPRWNHRAKAAFIGMDMTTSKDDMTRAVLEGVGYNLKLILDILEGNGNIDNLIMIGGGAKSAAWLQILSDIWQKELLVPQYLEEATSMGAAVCAGVGIGAFADYASAKQFNRIEKTVMPNPANKGLYDHMCHAFESAYQGLIQTFDQLSDIKSGQ